MKKKTMKDIAMEAGVSITTVSKILNNVDMHISEATRERVLGIVQKYHYVPNEIAKGLRRKSSNMIGVVTYDIADPYIAKIVTGIESACRAKGISVLICNTDTEKSSELDSFRFLRSKMVDGIIFLRSLSSENAESISQFKIPIVVVDHGFSTDISDVGIVDVNSHAAAYKATELLIRKGCRQISYIGPSPSTGSTRIEGYINALKDCGREIRADLIYQQGDFSSETGLHGIASLFAGGCIDGVLCGNDLIAAGALLALSEKRLRVPEDIKVVGIDNISISQYLNPPLTTVDLHGREVGVESAEMLMSRIQNDVPLGEKFIDCEIVSRKSV
ncbi:LacI family DNA-binding transcriptional regulator [Neobittarella massiliensis]|uniref:LacI family DNA-binding transcriptional regulator n=1 Tax=Neobittarella massiliensis (ex Bilen et al. 2018) TaxID=2041842 RepID=A0A8J6IMA5_9FIRM|nr:LacI family DNA-binding transcriptional regulator [Neobittarella massiliensis]MBC3514888.1 LacI family DNA-binding transcriptional regulator [Neobittarella massiliensis]